MLTLYDFSPRAAFWTPVIGVPIFCFVAISFFGADKLRLERDGVVTSALVTEKFPRDHQTVEVSYQVRGSTYQARILPRERDAGYEQIRPGDSVVITYLPADPAVAMGGPRPAGTRGEPWGVAVFGLLAGLVLGSSNARRIRRHWEAWRRHHALERAAENRAG